MPPTGKWLLLRVVLACFSNIDTTEFVERILLEFQYEITKLLVVICETVPDFMMERMNGLHV